jgi:hypothetical protein
MPTLKRFWRFLAEARFGFWHLLLALAIVASAAAYQNTSKERQLTAAFFTSPLPDVRLAVEDQQPDSRVYQRKYEFTTDWFNYNVPVWEQALAPFKGQPNVSYLEVGTYEGRSILWAIENILTHPSSRLTAIDIFDGPYKERYFANLARSGGQDRVTSIANYSQLALRELPLESFDIIYIDGSHAKQDVLEDAVLSWRLLKKNGILIFDDYRWAGCFVEGTCDAPTDVPKPAIDAFLQCFDRQLEVIHNSYQVVARKR